MLPTFLSRARKYFQSFQTEYTWCSSRAHIRDEEKKLASFLPFYSHFHCKELTQQYKIASSSCSVWFYRWNRVSFSFFCIVPSPTTTICITCSMKFLTQNNFSFPLISLHSDGKVRVYRLSTVIRRLNQEHRWQKLKSIQSQHQQQQSAFSARNYRIRRINQQEQHQQLFDVLRRNQNTFRTWIFYLTKYQNQNGY